MQTRIVQMGAAIAAVVLALTVARTEAFAASDKESCSTTSTDVTLKNPTALRPFAMLQPVLSLIKT
jgi:hypothetical protein